MAKYKRALALALCAALVALSAGCAPISFELRESDVDVALPSPEKAPPPAPTGDSAAGLEIEAALYYPSADRQSLTGVSRTLALPFDDSPYERAITELLQGPTDSALCQIAPEGTRVLSVEESGSLVTVDLSIDARNVDGDQRMAQLRAAIVATLMGMEGVTGVNVLVGGREEGVLGLPCGASGEAEQDLAALWARTLAEAERLETAGAEDWALERTVYLYAPTARGGYVAPLSREMVFESEEYLPALVEALFGSTAIAAAQTAPPRSYDLADGRRVALFSFGGGLNAALLKANISLSQLCASLCLTATSFVPELDGAMLYVNGDMVTELMLGEARVPFADGVLRRSVFAYAVADYAALYFADEEGGLIAVAREMSAASARSPRAILQALIGGPLEGEEGLAVMPEGMTEADLLGVRVQDGVALVNLSSNFYRCCQSFSPERERDAVYAMVNALTELHGVNAVRFYIEGETVETLVTSICLLGELMRSPGSIVG